MSDRVPNGLRAGGRKLWVSVLDRSPDLSEVQRVQLLEACRNKDRADQLDAVLRGDVDTWARLSLDITGEVYDLRIDAALTKALACAEQMKKLIAALRLPDQDGTVPQRRGPRGSYAPRIPGGAPKPPTDLEQRRLAAEQRRARTGSDFS